MRWAGGGALRQIKYGRWIDYIARSSTRRYAIEAYKLDGRCLINEFGFSNAKTPGEER
jgi:hypothetical protein